MTKIELINWITQNIDDDAGNIECAMRLLANNINAINDSKPVFEVTACRETINAMSADIFASDFFGKLQAMRDNTQ